MARELLVTDRTAAAFWGGGLLETSEGPLLLTRQTGAYYGKFSDPHGWPQVSRSLFLEALRGKL